MTRRCFVIGHPIAHSRSPLIHGTWLADHGLDGSYERIDVAPADLPAFITRLRAGEFVGGNVTVPHKQAAEALIDEVSEAARAIGAVNTLWREGGRLCGDNTDAAGFLGHLDATTPGWLDHVRTALVIGAGGAARAVVYALKSRGLDRIAVVNRNPARAAELVAAFGAPLQAMDWSARSALVGEADLIVNTTSLGMKGQPPLGLDLATLRPGTIVDDIVYVPLKTDLLVEAERRGAIAVDGLGMLLHQAVPGFARWFGVVPEVTPALRARLEVDIVGA
ncbi:shikimate dehydrogenase [Bosea sp. PAMC 26642]|uniref:shikimate dehydrogenase n=1 Tax=Bosea sp. (strain PAMC 26642) TaxID=1792307 RepID=UPI0007704B29|nr:shikimate dehydrogenase [Bosea sp. PAMC 26642]AMJ62165.1 shikimate dehydrogenase [Bosea sp. PAMC 26642]